MKEKNSKVNLSLAIIGVALGLVSIAAMVYGVGQLDVGGNSTPLAGAFFLMLVALTVSVVAFKRKPQAGLVRGVAKAGVIISLGAVMILLLGILIAVWWWATTPPFQW